jgi:hypothetical protein
MKIAYIIWTSNGRATMNGDTVFFTTKEAAKNHELWFRSRYNWNKVSIRKVNVTDDVVTLD